MPTLREQRPVVLEEGDILDVVPADGCILHDLASRMPYKGVALSIRIKCMSDEKANYGHNVYELSAGGMTWQPYVNG